MPLQYKEDRPGDERSQMREIDAGVVEPKAVRLSSDPEPYFVQPREESGPEAIPPAVIEGEFRPITDIGAPTNVRNRSRGDRS